MSRHTRRRPSLQVRLTAGGAGILAPVAAVTTVNFASAGEAQRSGRTVRAGHAVFVQGNELAGNTIHAFVRGDDGVLSAAGRYSTGGRGGDQVDAPTDSLASRGSLVDDDRSGLLQAVNKSAGDVPFAVTFDRGGRMLVAEAGKPTVGTYRVSADGTLKVVQQPLPNGQNTLCRLEHAGDFFHGGNTGNSTVTGCRTDRHGKLALTNEVGVATPPSAMSQGVIDVAVTGDDRFLYVQNAVSGTVDGFRAGGNGSLAKVTTVTGLPAFAESGMEGIVAV
ncbi:hypothetical protein RB628_11195 [Streptomyces sp. ADMS]|uniref:hypothetical protein n=1 Tax=Streptomyces sp. ADMS TaxID=3071415 RepID=UPI00296FBC89|nr:hypothetical protein [Streptomyces sp. ADMS]MDW4905882.1 hypothetical protein [Streptomyces sp. ADMS]